MIKVRQLLYIVDEANSGYVKLGVTNQDPESRLSNLQTGNPRTLELSHIIEIPGNNQHRVLEKNCKNWFSNKRVQGEWYQMDADYAFHCIKDAING
jgi:hypothetical protein